MVYGGLPCPLGGGAILSWNTLKKKKKTGRGCHGKKASELHSSSVSASVPASRFLSWFLVLTFLKAILWSKYLVKTNTPFSPYIDCALANDVYKIGRKQTITDSNKERTIVFVSYTVLSRNTSYNVFTNLHGFRNFCPNMAASLWFWTFIWCQFYDISLKITDYLLVHNFCCDYWSSVHK